MKKSILIAVMLALLLALLLQGIPAGAQEPQLQKAPSVSGPVGKPPVINGHGTGYRPPPMDLSHLTGRTLPGRFKVQQSPPASWDWRTQGVVTPVRDQGNCGSCWAFAAIGNIESKMLIDIPYTYDFSENNTKECEYWEVNGILGGTSCDGGNYFIAANWLSQKGTVLETHDPYVDSDVACTSVGTYQKTLLDWRIICGDVVPDTTVLKTYIETYGPVYTTIFAGNSGTPAWQNEFGIYNGSYTLYYTGTQTPNHAVLIVGWDDTLVHTGGTGGWIVKNSWGTSWGNSGYFTIAYGSASIGKNSSFIYGWQDYDDNGQVMSYDEAGWTTQWGQTGGGNPTCWGLVKFTAASNTYVKRVEFWTTDVTTDVDVYIYDTFSGGALSNLLASKLDNSFAEAGYHSVELDSPQPVNASNDIYAVVKFTNSSYGYPVPADYLGPQETGRTYISLTGANGSWQEAAGADVAIRVRTGSSPYFLSSYSNSGHGIHCNDFSDYATENIVYLGGKGLVGSHPYRVAYYDSSNNNRATDNPSSDASGNLSSEHPFAAPDAAGTWHVIVCEQTQDPPPTYDANWASTLASDSFDVQSSAIPEFPTALAAIVALALSAGVYLWMRRKVTPVRV